MLAAILAAIEGYGEGVTPQVEKLLLALTDSAEPLSSEALMASLSLKDRMSFRARYLVPALEQGLVEMTLPDNRAAQVQEPIAAVSADGGRSQVQLNTIKVTAFLYPKPTVELMT